MGLLTSSSSQKCAAAHMSSQLVWSILVFCNVPFEPKALPRRVYYP